MVGTEIIARRTYRDSSGEFSIGLRQPYRDGDDWFCDVFTEGLGDEAVSVGGVDALQAIRLALEVVDAIVESRPGAESMGINGTF